MLEVAEYRATFETVESQYAAETEFQLGENCWPSIDFDTLRWHTVVSTGWDEVLRQHAQLKEWAHTHQQPIRNVKLEKLVETWELVE